MKIADKSKEIDFALRRLGFTSLKDWAAARGLDHNISDTEIGSITLDSLLSESKSDTYARFSEK